MSSSGAVFLSYGSEDAQAAQHIADALRAAGIEVWFDREELRGGDSWDRKIQNQIRDCRLFIPIISANTQRRDEGYFRREWRLAVERAGDMAETKAFLVPVVIDETSERGASVPEKFLHVQWSRLAEASVPQGFVRRIAALLGAEETATSSSGTIATASVARATAAARIKIWPWVSLPVLILAVCGGWYTWRHSTTPTIAEHATRAQPAPERSIAVLPFLDLSEKHDQEYFADGIADELLDLLTQVPGLRVIGRTSSFQFKGKNEDLRTVGRTLGVSHVVEGSVRRYGDQVRITAQLVRSVDGAHEWSGTYDRYVPNALQVQKEIATSVASALEISFSPVALAASTETAKPEAYDLFLKGRHAEGPLTRQALADAEVYYRQALEVDPDFLAAQEALAVLHLIQAANSFATGESGYPRVREEANQLLVHNPNSLVGHALICRYDLAYAWNWTEAKRECEVALRINPRNHMANYQSAELALALGEPAKAELLFRGILSINPLDGDALVELSDSLMIEGRFPEAEAQLRKALAVNPSMYAARYLLGISLLAQRRLQEALQAFQSESPEFQQAGAAMAYHSLGRNGESAKALQRYAQEYGTSDAFGLAEVNAYVGNTARALQYLDTALREHDAALQYVKADWLLKPLYSDARFKAFLRKMNLEE